MGRIIGAVMLVFSAVLLGRALRKRECGHLRALECALDWIYQAKRKIELFSIPYAELLEDCPFCQTEESRKNGGDAVLHDLCEDAEAVTAFLGQLGTGYKKDTLHQCDHILAILEEKKKKLEANYPARIKLYAAMPLLIALSLIVMIL